MYHIPIRTFLFALSVYNHYEIEIEVEVYFDNGAR